MKITVTVDIDGKIASEKIIRVGAINKKPRGEVGKVKKLTPAEKKEKKRLTEGEDKEMTKTLKKLGVKPK